MSTMTDDSGHPEQPGFWRRYRMPIILGIIAFSLYVGSILYIIYGRGQIA